ncbi:hypothetical protein [Pseudomonas oryzihabitans]|uniref:hypothetical protein n=1 Tax=Pseudomonas oryzihabitans TaxID=47885 RepID=UPI00289481E5|nr:hypothetical protein [Pseudomonas oryzihabitans]MDT3722954.1 hypothetical protein [Pseudomonas oryzihabitans]
MSIATGYILGLPMSEGEAASLVPEAADTPAFSERQRAVAQTWAEHFRIEPKNRAAFTESYLSSTLYTRFWTVELPALETPDHVGRVVIPVLARLSDDLQYFDGHQVWTIGLSKGYEREIQQHLGDQALLEGPTLAQASLLAQGVIHNRRHSRSGLLTSFSKDARELTFSRAAQDLAPWFKLRTGDRFEARYCRPRTAFYGKHLGATLKRFNAHLDPDVLRLIRGIRCPDTRLYNWICDPQGQRAWRLQAVRAQPVLLPLLLLWPDELTQEQRIIPAPRQGYCPWPALASYVHGECLLLLPQLLATAVDQALPLHEVLAWLFQVPVAHLRYLGRQRVYDTGGALSFLHPLEGERGFRVLLGAATTGNRRPQSKADWKAFREVWGALPYVNQIQRDLTGFIKGGPARWSDADWIGLCVRAQDLSELHRDLSEGDPLNALLDRFQVQRSAAEIARLADRYQAQRRALVAQHQQAIEREEAQRFQSFQKSEGWPGLLVESATVLAPNGLEIVELLTPQALVHEHHALCHCVDQYDYAALSGDCRLFSVRRDGVSLATAEIIQPGVSPYAYDYDVDEYEEDYEDNSPQVDPLLKVQQLRGYRNASLAPESAEKQAWDWFWHELLKGHWPLRLDWPQHIESPGYERARLALERSLPALTQWLAHQLRDVAEVPSPSRSDLEVDPVGLHYASDLHYLNRFADLEDQTRPLRAWSDVFTPDSIRFAQRIYSTSHDSVHPKQIVGYAALDHTAMSWKCLMRDGPKIAENLAWLERNPRYYFDGSTPGVPPDPVQLATLDGLEFYVTGQGLHRACIARYLVEQHPEVLLRNVRVTRYDLRQDFIELCGRFNARMQALDTKVLIRPLELATHEMAIHGGTLERCDLALLIELNDSREWVVDAPTAERFLQEIDAAACREPTVKRTFSARMLNRLLKKLGPLAMLGGVGRG